MIPVCRDHVDLDGDLLARLITYIPLAPILVEMPPDRIPRSSIRGLTGDAANGLGHHAIDDCLVGVIRLPPIAVAYVVAVIVGSSPVRRTGIVNPYDPTRMYPFSYANGIVR